VSAVTGACLATRAEVFRKMEGFDSIRYAISSNDVDYCLRLRQQGLAVVYNPYATLYHFESKTRDVVGRTRQHAEAVKDDLTLRARWQDEMRWDPYLNPHFDRTDQPCTRLQPPLSPSRIVAEIGRSPRR
jgi:hypothetical protein